MGRCPNSTVLFLCSTSRVNEINELEYIRDRLNGLARNSNNIKWDITIHRQNLQVRSFFLVWSYVRVTLDKTLNPEKSALSVI